MNLKLILGSLFVGSCAFAGGVDGGGGKGIVCRNGQDAITSAEVLDLYEAKVMYGFNIPKTSEPMMDQIKRALSNFTENRRYYISSHVDGVLKGMRFTPADTQLLNIDDSFEVVIPKYCKAEQLANFYSENLILINSDIWGALSETDRAALILHEAVYAANRAVGAKNSIQSRHIVANIFNGPTNWVDIFEGVPKDALFCYSPSNGFYFNVYKDSVGKWIMQFQHLGPGYVYSKKTGTVNSPDFDFNEVKNFAIFPGEDKIGTGVGHFMQLRSNFEDGDSAVLHRDWEAVKDANGNVLKGFQAPRYYLSWKSSYYPNYSFIHTPMNCMVSTSKDITSK